MSLGRQVCFFGRTRNECVNISRMDMSACTHKTEWGVFRASTVCCAGHLSCESFCWAKSALTRSVTNGGATLSILLVVEVQSDRIGLRELEERGSIWQAQTMFLEKCILDAKLHRAR